MASRGSRAGARRCRGDHLARAANREATVVFPRAHQYSWRATMTTTAPSPRAIHTGSRNTSSRTPTIFLQTVSMFMLLSWRWRGETVLAARGGRRRRAHADDRAGRHSVANVSMAPFRRGFCAVVYTRAAIGGADQLEAGRSSVARRHLAPFSRGAEMVALSPRAAAGSVPDFAATVAAPVGILVRIGDDTGDLGRAAGRTRGGRRSALAHAGWCRGRVTILR